MYKKYISVLPMTMKANSCKPNMIGSILGTRGINLMDFCKKFNDLTKDYDLNWYIHIKLFFYDSGDYNIFVLGPTIKSLLEVFVNGICFKSSDKFFISKKIVDDITNIKFKNMNSINYNNCYKSVLGTLKSMGVYISNE